MVVDRFSMRPDVTARVCGVTLPQPSAAPRDTLGLKIQKKIRWTEILAFTESFSCGKRSSPASVYLTTPADAAVGTPKRSGLLRRPPLTGSDATDAQPTNGDTDHVEHHDPADPEPAW